MPRAMLRLKKTFLFFLTLNLVLCSTKGFTQPLNQTGANDRFFCLTRTEKEQIATCFEQNMECHKQIEKVMDHADVDSWVYALFTGALGIAIGIAASK